VESAGVETVLAITVCVALVGLLSSLGGRLFTRQHGARWLWDNSTRIGWALILVGGGGIALGFLLLPPGNGLSALLALGSLLLIGGLWLVWA
jgi:hypothetical protein